MIVKQEYCTKCDTHAPGLLNMIAFDTQDHHIEVTQHGHRFNVYVDNPDNARFNLTTQELDEYLAPFLRSNHP